MAFRLAILTALCALFVTAVPTVASACTTNDPSPVWMTGMEHGVSSTVSGNPFATGTNSGGSGGPDSDPLRVRTGSYSLKLAPNGGPVYRGRVVEWKPVLVQRFYLRLDSLPSSDVRELASIYTVKSTAKNSSGKSSRYAAHLGYKASTGNLTVELNTENPGTRVEGNVPVAPGAWHLVELRYDVSTSTNKVDWRIDGVDQPQATLANGPSTLINEVFWGSTFSDTYSANYDDMMLSQTAGNYPLGGGRILRLGPNDSNGPHSGVQNFRDVENGVASNIGSTTWMGLTDVPFAPGRHIAQVANSSSSYVQIGFEDTAEPCIRAVSGWVAWDPQNTKSANNGTTKVLDGSNETVVHSGSMSYQSTSMWIRQAVVRPPTDTGLGWTLDRVNGLVARVGYSTDTSPRPWWDALMLEFEASP
jgi:hypothetical protein